MMKMRIIARCLMVIAMVLPLKLSAEDIDLFLGWPAGNSAPPNVLILVDNTANWTQPFQDEIDALVEAFGGLGSDGIGDINVGIMFFTETGNPNDNVDGGYVRAAIRPMTETNKGLYQDLLNGLDVGDDKSNGGKAGKTFAEAYHYFDGSIARSGSNKVKTDFNGNDGLDRRGDLCGGCAGSVPVWALDGNALDAFDGTEYNSPLTEGSCGGNYIIYISNGAVQDNASDNRTATDYLDDVGGDTTTIRLSPSGSEGNVADEWSRFMKQVSPLAITTYTIDVNKVTTGQGPGWSRLLKSIADESGGKYYDVSNEEIDTAIGDAVGQILVKNSVFASVALPASATAQSTFLNQIFVGLFRPAGGALPRWPGNLKQFKLELLDDGELAVVDADSTPIIENDGKLSNCARSFWTPALADAYWAYLDPNDLNDPSCPTAAAVSNSPDGSQVEKGGQGYKLRAIDPAGASPRTVYTCDPNSFDTCSSATTLLAFNTTNVSQSALDANDPTDHGLMVDWAIGVDTENENAADPILGGASVVEMRPSVHGDVIHTQPVAIDYNADPNDPAVVVFYSGNDGMLRAINGSRDSNHSGKGAGEEFWAFMPPEFYDQVKRLRVNEEVVKFPGSGPDEPAAGESKPYGIDGPITAFDDGTNRYIFAGMRRGGRVVYALDVSNVTSPAFMWKKGCPNQDNDTGCTDSDWEKVGQTWSPLQVMYADGYPDTSSAHTPLLIMGGGYDGCEDYDSGNPPTSPAVLANNNCASGTKGNVIYVLDAVSGAVVHSFDTLRGVAGAVTVVPVSDNNPLAMFAYAADTGGNIYRISGSTANTPIGESYPDQWIMTQIASLGCGPVADSDADTVGGCTTNRKFLFGPDVIRLPAPDEGRLGILIGSGDREKPLESYSANLGVENYFFALVDDPLTAAWLVQNASNTDAGNADGNCGADLICPRTLTEVGLDGSVVPGLKGWRFPLDPGEQVVTGALTLADVVNFSTHIPATPDAEECTSNLGTATSYNLNYADAEGERNIVLEGGLIPTPVGGMVILDDGTIVPFCIGCDKKSPISSKKVTGVAEWIQPVGRVYWNIEQ